MIKIKDYIFNGNEIKMFVDGERIKVVFKNDTHIYIDAKYDDIEWNYDSQERQYNEETEQLISSLQNKNYKLQDKIEELKKDLEIEINSSNVKSAQIKDKNIKIEQLETKIDRAIEYIKENKEGIDDCFEPYIGLSEMEIDELLHILKGEENESN